MLIQDEYTQESLKTLSTSTQGTWMLLLKSFNEKAQVECDLNEIDTNRIVGVFLAQNS